MSSVACHRSCKGTPSSSLKPSKKPRPIFLLPFTLNIISLNINIETIIHPDIIHTPSYIYIKGIYIIRYIIINSQSRHYTPHTPHYLTQRFIWFMLIYIYALIQSSCRFALLLPVGQWVYDKSRVLPLSAFKSNHSHLFWRGVGGEAFLLTLNQQSRVRLLIRVLSVIRVRHFQAAESPRLIRADSHNSCSLKNSPPCSHCISVFTQNLSQKRNRLRCPTKQTSLALEASFIAQRSKLHFFRVFLVHRQTHHISVSKSTTPKAMS